ncbi:uncharacterized protein N0V89_011934 [Didymosphaeria variabile]|uniref:DUF7730 domain-containing protein n=1 Tax=Didymosphaeria variabile TaxID=1932322 RepID=A0A9W9C680_9PLEO|nr:uncharacterized protein N0V89_011934 [Didymosphaeria variabile]KAJ4345799.1 hypothetical protein N0V89_011934 [Didymosphaeria variabile]
MAPVSPTVARKSSKARAIGDDRARVTKQKSVKQARKPKNGLLDASIPHNATHLMELAQRNSTQSPLLRLAPEIRNTIWEYAIGGSRIRVFSATYFDRPSKLSYWPFDPSGEPIMKSAFQLHKVCRQVYAETAPLLYTLNMFSFYHVSDMDRWIKLRPIGQLQLMTSIEVPFQYFSLYDRGLRTKFRKKFPNIKRISIQGTYTTIESRREESKKRVVNMVKQREGEDVEVHVVWR